MHNKKARKGSGKNVESDDASYEGSDVKADESSKVMSSRSDHIDSWLMFLFATQAEIALRHPFCSANGNNSRNKKGISPYGISVPSR